MDERKVKTEKRRPRWNLICRVQEPSKKQEDVNEELNLLPVGISEPIKDDVTPSPRLWRGRSQSLFDMELGASRQAPKLEAISEETFLAYSLQKPCRRSDRRLRKLNTQLLQAVKSGNCREVNRLLTSGASPNATCYLDYVSACHLAAFVGGDALSLLIKFGAEKFRKDRLGRTPLHLAAWAGNTKQIASLLDFPEDLLKKVQHDVTREAVEDIKKQCTMTKKLSNVRCELDEANIILPKDWRDDIDHDCRNNEESLPLLQPGWTPLHAASANARHQCTRLLLAAGSNPIQRDLVGRTPLDVVGASYYNGQNIDAKHFAEVVKLLLAVDGNTHAVTPLKKSPGDTPLHTAVEVESLDAITELLKAGASVTSLNRSGLSPLHLCVKKKLKEHLLVFTNHTYSVAGAFPAVVDVIDKDGHTVLHFAVLANWAPGVCVCLEAGASITAKANDGETPIHLAAELGDPDILNEILSVAKQNDNIDYRNAKEETALFKAVIHEHVDCVKKLLKDGASIKINLPRQVNIFHVAAELGLYDILKVLLDHDYTITRGMINFLTADDRKGFGPIHFAAWNNHPECVKLLLSRNAYVSLRTSYGLHRLSTPLHIAAMKNEVEIAKILVKFDQTTVHNVDNMKWTPLHTASHYRSRDIILFLLREGADISLCTGDSNKLKKTPIEMIMNNLSKPTEFMEDVFDSYINSNNLNLHDSNCEVTIDYGILTPRNEYREQMEVIQSVIETGNRQDQRRLLLHPLIESFLYLKWKALLPFFYTIIVLYGFFVLSLTILIVSVFFYKDTNGKAPSTLNAYSWTIVVYFAICLLISQEILYMIASKRHLLQLETWIKFASITLALILSSTVVETISTADWPRHVATLALLLSWIEMLFLLSRFPKWGYYVLMFKKVTSNVLKILLTFGFLLIGFSLSFMIQFRSQIPFENPWAALIKTMVMMTSEFDYDDMIDNKDLKKNTTSLLVMHIVFFGFLVLAAIVLMNLMVGVAVNDLHNLEILGKIKRLEKQAEFLGSLETLVFNNVFTKVLPVRVITNLTVCKLLTLSPCKPSSEHYEALSSHIRDAVFDKAQSKKKKMDDLERGSQKFKDKLDEIYRATVRKKEQRNVEHSDFFKQNDNPLNTIKDENDIFKYINQLYFTVGEIEKKLKLYGEESRSSNEVLKMKIDLILNRLETFKT